MVRNRSNQNNDEQADVEVMDLTVDVEGEDAESPDPDLDDQNLNINDTTIEQAEQPLSEDPSKAGEPVVGETKRRSVQSLDRIQSLTNQPVSDFIPTVAPEHEQAVDLLASLGWSGSPAAFAQAVADLVATREAAPDRLKAAEDALAFEEEQTAKLIENVQVLPPDLYMAREAARVRAEARLNRQKETVVGGRYQVNGLWVNANGEPVAAPESE
jgi:hypothetical protein